MLTTNKEELRFNILTPNCHQDSDMIVLGKCKGIILMVPSSTLENYKNQQFFRITKMSPKPIYLPPKDCKGLNQWSSVTLGKTLVYTTESILQTLTPNFHQNLEMSYQKTAGD